MIHLIISQYYLTGADGKSTRNASLRSKPVPILMVQCPQSWNWDFVVSEHDKLFLFFLGLICTCFTLNFQSDFWKSIQPAESFYSFSFTHIDVYAFIQNEDWPFQWHIVQSNSEYKKLLLASLHKPTYCIKWLTQCRSLTVKWVCLLCKK